MLAIGTRRSGSRGRTYDHAQVSASPGDLFVILTDGLTEHDKILSAARAFGPQADDQTLLLARVRGGGLA